MFSAHFWKRNDRDDVTLSSCIQSYQAIWSTPGPARAFMLQVGGSPSSIRSQLDMPLILIHHEHNPCIHTLASSWRGYRGNHWSSGNWRVPRRALYIRAAIMMCPAVFRVGGFSDVGSQNVLRIVERRPDKN